jgi:hypothetical protein
MEWRYSPQELTKYWRVGDSFGFVKSDDQIHNLSNAFRLKLKADEIEEVIVPNAEHLKKVKREFPDLRGKVRIWEDVS